VAFCPANVVPGIDLSNDPLLQGRLFSYLDTQLLRLGGPNFHQIPVNRPRCPFANHQRDGHMQMDVPKGRVNYEPASLDGAMPTARAVARGGFRSFAEPAAGAKVRLRPESFADHYSQARQFYRSQTESEQAHLAGALVFELSKVETVRVREAMVGHLRHVDMDLARRVADGLGLDALPPAPKAARPVQDLPPSKPLSIQRNMKDTLEGRMVGILYDEGSDARTIASLRKAVTGAGARVKLIAPKVGGAVLSDGTLQAADGQLAGTPSVVCDAVALVLTDKAAEKLGQESAAMQFVTDAWVHLKAIAFDDGARPLLEAAGVDAGADPLVVAARDAKAFVAAATQRHWEREPLVRMLP
jgi:catalase